MSKSIECANSATDMIMKSPFLLRSITNTLSEVPVSLTFGQVQCGADRVSVKIRSEDSDCMHCSVAELADLSDVVMDLVLLRPRKRQAYFCLSYTIHDACHYLANVPIQPQTRSHNLRTRCGP